MNKEDDKWVKGLRKAMEDYSEPLPNGLWEQLEGELSQAKIIPFWRRWPAVAAAVALVLIVSSLALTDVLWPSLDSPELQQANQVAGELVDDRMLAEELLSDGPSVVPAAEPVANSAFSASAKTIGRDEPSVAQVSLLTAMEDSSALDGDSSAKEDKLETEENLTSASSRFRSTAGARVAYNEPMLKRKKLNENRFEVGLLTGGIPYSSTKQLKGMSRFASLYAASSRKNVVMTNMGNPMTAYNQVIFKNREQNSLTDVKHRMPINVVASFKWHFTDDWALETGLSYTFLQSDLHAGSSVYLEDTQKLHYVGIPLKVHRNIWKNNRFAFYASAGGMVEKCVSGELKSVYVAGDHNTQTETISIDVDHLQWSVAAAVGAQVNMLSALSLFVEPGIAYYFDDHSRVETIRKEHPLNFNLQFGMRFNLSR